jgi:biopolymer transport protein ExbD
VVVGLVVRNVVLARCVADHWPDTARACMALASTIDELRACGSKLTREQATALTADFDEAATVPVASAAPVAPASTSTAPAGPTSTTDGSAAASTAAPCAQVADHARSLVHGFGAKATAVDGLVMRSIVLARCVADHWPDTARACMAVAPTIDELRACGSKLTPEQATALTADFDQAEDALSVEVHRSKGATPAMENHPVLILNIAADGAVTVAGKPFDDAGIDKLFHAVFLHDPKTEVVLRADRGASHRRVVVVMERAKAAGLTHLAIGTAR